MRSILKGLFVIVVYTSLLCHCQVQKQERREEFAKRVRNFSLELLYHASRALDNHLVVSPFQIWCIMTVLAQGTEGRSYDQLRNALNLPRNSAQLVKGYQNLTKQIEDSKTKSITVHTGSFMFLDQKFVLENSFKNSARDDFNTFLINVNFKDSAVTAAKANSLISRITEGRIPEALYASDFQEAAMILSNVIDFKGLWTFPFNASDTKREPFYNENGDPIGEVNMMYQRASLPFANVAKLKGYVLEMAYGENKAYSMLLILPHSGVSLADMFLNFRNVEFSEIFRRIDEDTQNFEGNDLDVWIPRFKITTDTVLNKVLNDMGIYDIFSPEDGDLSLISNTPVSVSKVTQKAILEVTEEGTTASAVASVLLPDRIEPPKVKANRPFVYLITEKSSSTILFAGIYSKPSLF